MKKAERGTRLQNVVIPTRCFEESVDFYRRALGLQVIHQGEGFCFFKAGSANLAVHAVEPGSVVAPTGHGFYLDLLVDDLAGARSALQKAGVSIEKEWLDKHRRYVLIADPDGNLIELIEPIGGLPSDERTTTEG
jgi:catechol 2,3-dioxygenase-like lactoylglutathione lyase family enzyme